MAVKSKLDSALGSRQQRFVDEYMIDLNATRAAIAAGYSKRTAAQAGWEVLRNPKVAEEIGHRQTVIAEELSVSAKRVIDELALIGFSNIADYHNIDEQGEIVLDIQALMDRRRAGAITQIEVLEYPNGKRKTKIKLADKRAALTDLGKHLGLFGDRSAVALEEAAITEEPSTRELALAALALLNEAAHKTAVDAPMIEGVAVE